MVLARDTFFDCERVEMRTLAQELDVGRSTLYRWFGDRDKLLGEIMWGLCEGLFDQSQRESAERGLTGPDRIGHALDHFWVRVNGFAPLQFFLTNEPEAALRILTTRASPVQDRCIEWLSKRISEEQESGTLRDDVPADALAYALIRIGEAFLYADQITGVAVEREASGRVIRALLGA